MTPFLFLRKLLDARLSTSALRWLKASVGEIADGPASARFCALFSQAARHARRVPLAPQKAEVEGAGRIVEGWNPERWSVLEAARVTLILARADLPSDGGALALAEAFRYADEGELCALLRSLALLPGAERLVWRAGEGCRSNMRSVFEAAALDTPFPSLHFDDLAWRQCVIKCLFVGAPLWRLWGLDARLSPELARMALDLADERRSAGRPVPHELWLCLGPYGAARGLDALERELAGDTARLALLERRETDPAVLGALTRARKGETGAATFRHLEAMRT
jgi:hypothetical protein